MMAGKIGGIVFFSIFVPYLMYGERTTSMYRVVNKLLT